MWYLNTFICSMNSHEEEAFLIQTFLVIRAQIMESSLLAFNLYSIMLTSIILKSSNQILNGSYYEYIPIWNITQEIYPVTIRIAHNLNVHPYFVMYLLPHMAFAGQQCWILQPWPDSNLTMRKLQSSMGWIQQLKMQVDLIYKAYISYCNIVILV